MHPPLPKLFCEHTGFPITPLFLLVHVQRLGGVMLPPRASPWQSTWLARVASCAAPTVWLVQPSTATPDEGDTDTISGAATPAQRHGWNDRYGLCLLMYTCFFHGFLMFFVGQPKLHVISSSSKLKSDHFGDFLIFFFTVSKATS